MSYMLFLDDERVPNKVTWVRLPSNNPWDWVIVRNFDEFCKTIQERGIPVFVSYDHDLADEHYREGFAGTAPRTDYKEKTGYDCAKWLKQLCDMELRDHPTYTVHSMNPVGRQNIHNLLMGR